MARGGARPGAGRPKKAATTPRDAGTKPAREPVKAAADRLPADITAPASAVGLSPLDYMLQVMRDPSEDPVRRDRMAMAAAPFVHSRAADVKPGKKDLQAEAAGQVVAGKFGPRQPPKLVSNGG